MKRYRMEQEGKPDVTFEVDFKRLLVFAPDRRFGKSTYTRKACVRGNLAEKLAERTAFYIAQGYQPTEGFTNVREGWVFERGPLEQCEPSLMAYRPKPRMKELQNAWTMASQIAVPWVNLHSSLPRKLVMYQEHGSRERQFDMRGTAGAFIIRCTLAEALVAYLFYLANAGVTDLILSTRDNTVLLGQRALPAVMDATTGKVRATMNMLGLTKPEFASQFAEAIGVSGRPALVL